MGGLINPTFILRSLEGRCRGKIWAKFAHFADPTSDVAGRYARNEHLA